MLTAQGPQGTLTPILFPQVSVDGVVMTSELARGTAPPPLGRVLALFFRVVFCPEGFPGGSVVNLPLASAGDSSWIPGSGRSPEKGNGNPLHYSCLGNPMDRGAWWAIVRGVIKSLKRLSN